MIRSRKELIEYNIERRSARTTARKILEADRALGRLQDGEPHPLCDLHNLTGPEKYDCSCAELHVEAARRWLAKV